MFHVNVSFWRFRCVRLVKDPIKRYQVPIINGEHFRKSEWENEDSINGDGGAGNVYGSRLTLFSLPGVIRTALPNMDRETRDQYVLVIQAKDMVGQMGGLSGTTSVTVTLTDVNDNPPRFSHSETTVSS